MFTNVRIIHLFIFIPYFTFHIDWSAFDVTLEIIGTNADRSMWKVKDFSFPVNNAIKMMKMQELQIFTKFIPTRNRSWARLRSKWWRSRELEIFHFSHRLISIWCDTRNNRNKCWSIDVKSERFLVPCEQCEESIWSIDVNVNIF